MYSRRWYIGVLRVFCLSGGKQGRVESKKRPSRHVQVLLTCVSIGNKRGNQVGEHSFPRKTAYSEAQMDLWFKSYGHRRKTPRGGTKRCGGYQTMLALELGLRPSHFNVLPQTSTNCFWNKIFVKQSHPTYVFHQYLLLAPSSRASEISLPILELVERSIRRRQKEICKAINVTLQMLSRTLLSLQVDIRD